MIRRPVAQEGHARRRPTRATAHTHRARVANALPPRPPWHLGTLPIETPMCCQHVLPRPRRATTCRRCRAAQARPKAHSAAAHPASSIPASARAHPHACWNAAGCAIHAATWTDELCDSKADAGAIESRRRTNSEQQESAHDLTRDSARSGPAPSRTRRFGRTNSLYQGRSAQRRALEYAYSGCTITWHGTVQSDTGEVGRGRGSGVVVGERRSGTW